MGCWWMGNPNTFDFLGIKQSWVRRSVGRRQSWCATGVRISYRKCGRKKQFNRDPKIFGGTIVTLKWPGQDARCLMPNAVFYSLTRHWIPLM